MSFRSASRHDIWNGLVQNNRTLLSELPREALANKEAFRDYVTSGTHRRVVLKPSVFELSSEAITNLWTFINQKTQFDMDATLFDNFNEAFRRCHERTK